jgi:hypothetical protein
MRTRLAQELAAERLQAPRTRFGPELPAERPQAPRTQLVSLAVLLLRSNGLARRVPDRAATKAAGA